MKMHVPRKRGTCGTAVDPGPPGPVILLEINYSLGALSLFSLALALNALRTSVVLLTHTYCATEPRQPFSHLTRNLHLCGCLTVAAEGPEGPCSVTGV